MIRKEASNREMFSVVQQLLEEGETVKVSVKGQSMLPFFISGTTVVLHPIAESDFVKGNVVLGDTGRNYVIHRILKVEGDMVTLFGDGNIIGTESMPREKVYGIVRIGRFHKAMARIWLWMRPVRRYPLWILRRITPK